MPRDTDIVAGGTKYPEECLCVEFNLIAAGFESEHGGKSRMVLTLTSPCNILDTQNLVKIEIACQTCIHVFMKQTHGI